MRRDNAISLRIVVVAVLDNGLTRQHEVKALANGHTGRFDISADDLLKILSEDVAAVSIPMDLFRIGSAKIEGGG